MRISITENQLKKVEFKYLDYIFDGIYEVKSKKFPDYRYWKIKDDVVLELVTSGDMWVSNTIWRNFSSIFSSEYNETQLVMKEWLEEHLNLEGITPEKHFGNRATSWKSV